MSCNLYCTVLRYTPKKRRNDRKELKSVSDPLTKYLNHFHAICTETHCNALYSNALNHTKLNYSTHYCTLWTSSQKLGRHASLRVRSVWKKLGPGKLQVKEVWAQNIFIDFLAELVNSFLLKFVWADHPSPPPLTHTPDQFQEILPRPKMFSLIFSLNWIVKKKITDLPPHPPSTNFRNPTQPKNEI